MTTQDAEPRVQLEPPRFESRGPIQLAGLRGHFDAGTRDQIPALWQRFMPQLNAIPTGRGCRAYGACFFQPGAEGFDYMAAADVAGVASVPMDWTRVTVPPLRYAVFVHRGHVSTFPLTLDAIWHQWLPTSGRARATGGTDVPAFLERYGEKFDPQTASGEIEVWVPVRN